jgi:L-alanine-DL-glutamate epimerase-like enolase superfamily enzyme
MPPSITRIENIEFSFPLEDVGKDESFNLVYEPGAVTERKLFALRIHTDVGITGEYVGGSSPAAAQINLVADYLIGKNPLNRERHWSELKRALRKYDRLGMGPLDIALWDFAGKYYDASIHELLGSYRKSFPTYASTYHGDRNGGLDSPEAYADFAEACLDRGFPGFKIHGWGGEDGQRNIDREIETVHAVGERVGDEMDLMLDPACEYETFADALAVGRACDDEGFLWYEDPYRDGGLSQYSHRKLAEMLDTLILPTEHARGLEPLTDFLSNEGTEILRVDPEHNAGITGAMKAARVAEGFGVDIEFHGPGPAKRHCIAATRNTNYYELALVHPECQNTTPPVYRGPYQDNLDSVRNGTVAVPKGPGLGVEYDWSYIEDNRTGSRTYT